MAISKGDIAAYATPGSTAGAVKTVTVGPVLFRSGSSVKQSSDIPITVVYELRDSAETKLLKREGAIIYIEAAPFVKVFGEFADGTTGTREQGLGQPPNYDKFYKSCDEAYMVALAPQNNYKIKYTYDRTFKIRQEGAADWGKWGNSVIRDIKPGGKIIQASLKRISPSFRGTCYFTQTKAFFGK